MTPEQFSSVFREHIPALSRYLARRVPLGEVDDLASQIFEVAWRKRDQVKTGEELPWLYRIAAFQVANFRRREASAAKYLRFALPPDSAPSAEVIAVLDFDLANAWKLLSEGEKQVLSLVAFEDLSVIEAAKVCGIRPNAASIKLHRARKKLQTALAEK